MAFTFVTPHVQYYRDGVSQLLFVCSAVCFLPLLWAILIIWLRNNGKYPNHSPTPTVCRPGLSILCGRGCTRRQTLHHPSLSWLIITNRQCKKEGNEWAVSQEDIPSHMRSSLFHKNANWWQEAKFREDIKCRDGIYKHPVVSATPACFFLSDAPSNLIISLEVIFHLVIYSWLWVGIHAVFRVLYHLWWRNTSKAPNHTTAPTVWRPGVPMSCDGACTKYQTL